MYALLDRRVEAQDFPAGSYSSAAIATWPWISRYEWQSVDLDDYPNLERWYLEIADRPAV